MEMKKTKKQKEVSRQPLKWNKNAIKWNFFLIGLACSLL